MSKIPRTSLLLVALALGLGLSHAQDTARPLNLPGLPNAYRVSEQLYRGGQPQAAGASELKKLGIKTVVNLSSIEQDHRFFRDSGVRVVHLPMSTFFPKKQHYRQFLDIFADPARTPVFVHCRHGSDRTGAAVALYRIHIQRWDKEKAVTEMAEGPFGFHLIHSHLKQFVRRFEYRPPATDDASGERERRLASGGFLPGARSNQKTSFTLFPIWFSSEGFL